MEIQISLWFDDRKIPEKNKITANDVLIDRGSRYGYAFTQVTWKEGLKNFLNEIRSIKPFDSADHCSYAFRIRSSEGLLIEWKWDDWETWAWLCILRELKRGNAEQVILIISRHFGGIYLQNDRYMNIVQVSRMAISNMKS
ncbi:MAG: hypothetical protein ACD_3C00208G0005 [uncultured bacterium (gcode 4)]|uniref:Impact N-terminal domain-containing protein n=1 Tax=uncultured bacterium (gcode 4) TaxID=1234023 RepID=K2FWT1_9BACT|nr:MAG: hypothetical protein ACD_3C00208G0005 [uncultured bacterium (gcode 4)]